uniref:ShKT domain-containing protein n=1 Tax=Romanomermis culicivorax TaxID=13658 RepID=A0A915JEL3_ROMCU
MMNIIFTVLSVVYIRRFFSILSLFEFSDLDEQSLADEGNGDLLNEILGENAEHGYSYNEDASPLMKHKTNVDRQGCFNHYELCDFWSKKGECSRNKNFMWKYCEGSCNPKCEGRAIGITDVDCTDDHKLCPEWASDGECENNPLFMMWNCRKSCHPKCTKGNSVADLENY